MTRRSLLVVLLATTAAAVAAGGYALYYGQPAADIATSDKARIGGPFELTRHDGKRVSDKDFRGAYMLVFFGYTSCPDVCPAQLKVISAALDRLGEKARRIQPVFITVDPERDSPRVLARYVSAFHPRLVGLTGTTQEIARVTRAYGVYHARVKDSGQSKDYLMTHTTTAYLMAPDGRFVKHLSYTTDVEAMAAALSAALDRRG